MRRVLGLALTTVLGVGLAAFYVMPALLELDLIQIRAMTEHDSDFHRNFVPPWLWTSFTLTYRWNFGGSVRNVDDLMPLHISAPHWVLMVVALGVAMIRIRRRTVDIRVASLIQWLAVTAFAMFMMTSGSTFVWEAVPALSYIQFPWRFFMLLSISGAALGALLMSFASSRQLQAALLIVAVGVQVHLYHRRLKPGQYLPVAEMNIDDPGWRDTEEAHVHGYYEHAYDPAGITSWPTAPVPQWAVVMGSGTVDAQAIADDSFSLRSSSDGEMTVRIYSHAFPGWVAQIDGRQAQLDTTSPDGYMEVAVPPGAHTIEVRLTDTPVRAAANAISIASMTVLAMVVLLTGSRKLRAGRSRSATTAAVRRLA
jgi:hypothetical protein